MRLGKKKNQGSLCCREIKKGWFFEHSMWAAASFGPFDPRRKAVWWSHPVGVRGFRIKRFAWQLLTGQTQQGILHAFWYHLPLEWTWTNNNNMSSCLTQLGAAKDQIQARVCFERNDSLWSCNIFHFFQTIGKWKGGKRYKRRCSAKSATEPIIKALSKKNVCRSIITEQTCQEEYCSVLMMVVLLLCELLAKKPHFTLGFVCKILRTFY